MLKKTVLNHEYQTFGLIKIHNMCKIWFANKIFIQFVKKFGLQLTGRQERYFLFFSFSLYPNFKWLLSKIL